MPDIFDDSLSDGQRAAIEQLSIPPDLKALERRFAVPTISQSTVKWAIYDGPPVGIGFDCEWLTRPLPGGGFTNDILCISAVLACEERRTRYVYYLAGTGPEHRPTLAAFLKAVFGKALAEGTIAAIPDKVTMFGHFIRGDVTAFSDFWARRSEFRGLGRTLASGIAGHSVEFEAEDAAA